MNKKYFLSLIPFVMLLFTMPALAAEQNLAPPPPLPEDGSQLPEPEINIIHHEDRTIEEYSINGKVRYAKITPKKGKAYYMIDTDGDGLLDKRDDNLDNPPINQWILLRW